MALFQQLLSGVERNDQHANHIGNKSSVIEEIGITLILWTDSTKR